MKCTVKVGDVLEERADVLICPANPWLSLSGGVNGAILVRGGQAVQDELQAHLRSAGRTAVEAGTVVCTGPGPLSVNHILHAVAIDPFYGSSVELVKQAIESALGTARSLGAVTVTMPMLATGYGPLKAEQFALAVTDAIHRDWSPLDHLTIVVRKDEDAVALRTRLNG